ncbi:hypothetical protein OG259_26735 [Streptomyces sp. NBC_00250]|uniref:hypothetical protein n=1 Tax=Streptomyces sp. NBC_00250 TaxID=2903641 RepID=UPI002E2E2651|nr:hypothetical protein [Streptomyces sp. NBC_00250]
MRVLVKVAKGVGEFVGELVGEAVLEALACLLVLGTLLGVGFLVIQGMRVSPAGTATAGGLFVLFAGYGAVQFLRGPERRGKGRLAAAGAGTFGALLVLAFLALYCSCW